MIPTAKDALESSKNNAYLLAKEDIRNEILKAIEKGYTQIAIDCYRSHPQVIKELEEKGYKVRVLPSKVVISWKEQ